MLDLDCRKCSESDKINNGCKSEPRDPSRWMFEGAPLKRCPIRLISYETLILIRYYGFYKEGYLVNKGPLGCQPAKLIEAFNLIDSEIAKLKEEKEE